MLKTHLAPGFRFHPTDVELVNYYLKRKVMGKKLRVEAIAEIEIYKFEPSDLPDKSYLRTGDLKWYFFCPRGKKYASGVRTNRATEFGYWKTTGKERDVLYNNEVVGKIKTLVYHCGKAPRGERTDWVMHEYRLEAKELAQMDVAQDAYVLCVVFKKDGPGPRNGAQYGAPFKEEEWSDGEDKTNNATALPSADGPIDLPGPCLATTSHARNDILAGMISESCVSDVAPNANMPLPLSYEDNTLTLAPILDSNSTPISAEATQTPGDDLCSMLDFFVEDERLCFGGYPRNETRHNSGVPRDGELLPLCLEADDVFSGLPDLGNFDHVPGMASYHYNCNATENSPLFLELEDLTEPLTVPVVQSENLGNRDSIFQMQDQFGSSSDLSCFATTRHGTLSSQSQSKSTHPYPGDLK